MEFEAMPMLSCPSTDKLISMKAASRLGAADSSLYDFDEDVANFASRFMGWTDLCSNPPYDPAKIMDFASKVRADSLSDIVLIGQGGSTQASMTMAALLDYAGQLDVGFHTMDCLSPEFIRDTLESIDPAKTIFIISSKSGSTLEPMMVFRCVWDFLVKELGQEAAGKRFVAITDPGSKLESMANEMGFLRVFHGQKDVGGRFSAMSVFGLVPFALMGIDVCDLLAECAEVQQTCSQDVIENPALQIASYFNESNMRGRDKVSIVFDESCKKFGLWLEQLLAESLGKQGKGILPNCEHDIDVLSVARNDRFSIVYSMAANPDNLEQVERDVQDQMSKVEESIPCVGMIIRRPVAVARHFVVWEYATAMLAALLQVNPFDQPDVESTKVAVREILYKNGEHTPGLDSNDFMIRDYTDMPVEKFELWNMLSSKDEVPNDADDALRLLFSSLTSRSYVSINAFLPSGREDRLEALEKIRVDIAKTTGCVTCLEMGPRYLHSIGQFQKGGRNRGIFLILSSDEEEDMPIPGEDFTMGYLAYTQARGDYLALNDNLRRVVHLHLRSNSVETINKVATLIHRHLPTQLS